MTRLKLLVPLITGMALAPTLSFAQTYSSKSVGAVFMNLNAATLKGAAAYSVGDIWARMRDDFAMPEVNPEIIRRQEQYYADRAPYFNRIVDRSKPYLYHILSEVEKRQMPAEVALLPFIESAFVTKAKSPVGASGLWQFMPATGVHYGLEQTGLYDGRHDVYAATDAALNYLQYLYGLFGDWSLALAAYNWGEGNVGKAVIRAQAAGLDPTYENLRMPNETRNYVPKLLAVRNLINNPDAFGLNLEHISDKPYFTAINLDTPLDVAAAARLAGISENEFLTLNPGFNVPVVVPGANRKVLLPVTAVNTFEHNLKKADKNTLLSYDIFKADSRMSLASIAEQTGMNISEIKRLNGISSNVLSAGRSVLVAKNSLSPYADDTGLHNLALNIGTPATAPQAVAVQAVAANTAAAVQRSADTVISIRPAKAPDTAPVLAAAKRPVAVEAVAAPIQISAATAASPEAADALMSLAQENSLRISAREAVEKVMAQPDPAVRVQASVRTAPAVQRAENRDTALQTAAADTQPDTHIVAEGDTLFGIARRYNISVADLVTANNINGSNIRQGQKLNVALAHNSGTSVRTAAASGSVRPVSYTVKKGDTLTAIAARFNVPVSTLQKVNNGSTLRPGQKIKLTDI